MKQRPAVFLLDQENSIQIDFIFFKKILLFQCWLSKVPGYLIFIDGVDSIR
jgi:hypothetical protein